MAFLITRLSKGNLEKKKSALFIEPDGYRTDDAIFPIYSLEELKD